jgi:hypothetical protein
MKNRTSGRTQKPIMEGADVFDAMQAFRNQEPQPIGWCLEDAGPLLAKMKVVNALEWEFGDVLARDVA